MRVGVGNINAGSLSRLLLLPAGKISGTLES